MTEEEFKKADSETERYRHLTRKYCLREDGEPGCGIDIASQGCPVVPWAFQLDLPPSDYAYYNANNLPKGPIQLRGYAERLHIQSDSLDFAYSSHLIEDFVEWEPVLMEWVRVIKPGGYLIILLPDKVRWNEAIANGQPPNCAHTHESHAGELSTYAERLNLTVIEDRLTDLFPYDYTILFVGKKNLG